MKSNTINNRGAVSAQSVNNQPTAAKRLEEMYDAAAIAAARRRLFKLAREFGATGSPAESPAQLVEELAYGLDRKFRAIFRAFRRDPAMAREFGEVVVAGMRTVVEDPRSYGDNESAALGFVEKAAHVGWRLGVSSWMIQDLRDELERNTRRRRAAALEEGLIKLLNRGLSLEERLLMASAAGDGEGALGIAAAAGDGRMTPAAAGWIGQRIDHDPFMLGMVIRAFHREAALLTAVAFNVNAAGGLLKGERRALRRRLEGMVAGINVIPSMRGCREASDRLAAFDREVPAAD